MTSETVPNSADTRGVVPPVDTEQQRVQASPPSSPVGAGTGPGAPLQQAPTLEQIKKPAGVDRDDPNIYVVDPPPCSPTFKEQVYGYARLVRGMVLGQPDVKEQGTQVLRGERSIPLRRGSQSSR